MPNKNHVSELSYTSTNDPLIDKIEAVLATAKQQGATAAEVGISTNTGFTVSVRMGEVETVEYHRDQSLEVTVYFGQCKANASTSDLQASAIQQTVQAACNIARYTSADEYSGLADSNLMAYDYLDLDLNHPWLITPKQAIEMAQECEAIGRNLDQRIVNSEGARISTQQTLSIYGNSHGFIGHIPFTYHNIECSLLAEANDVMQRNYYYSASRDANELKSISEIGKKAAERTINRLNAQRLKTQRAPVIFSSETATGLIHHFINAISGGNLYRQASFLIDHLNKPVFSKAVCLYECPHIHKALGSSPFDNEGVRTQDRDLVVDGILQGYVLSSYSARRLGMQTTGNAGGTHNLLLKATHHSLHDLLSLMGTGLLITEVMGQGINIVTGDYSRGACGFWVENGVIQYPVEEITIAGNLADMFKQIIAVSSEVEFNNDIRAGAILIESMMIAGE